MIARFRRRTSAIADGPQSKSFSCRHTTTCLRFLLYDLLACTLRGHIVQDAQVSSLTSLNIFPPASGVLRSYSSSAHRLHIFPPASGVLRGYSFRTSEYSCIGAEVSHQIFPPASGVFFSSEVALILGVCLLLSAGACRDDRS